MQQSSHALKRRDELYMVSVEPLSAGQIPVRLGASSRRVFSPCPLPLWALLAVSLLMSGCGAAWSGHWSGVADLGPVNTHTLTLTLMDKASSVQMANIRGGIDTLQVCARQIKGDQIILKIDPARPDCTPGADARPLRLEGTIGSSVIYGSVFRGQTRVGFFRAFRATIAQVKLMRAPAAATSAP